MLKWVIFDFDGTLVDSKNMVLPIFNHLAEKHNFNLIRQEVSCL